MICEIFCIGTELLHGDIVNTNAAYISKALAAIGIDVHYHSVVGDNPKRMREGFELAFSRADIVICTGGLGPTKDDITKEALADYFGLKLEYDEASMEHVKKIYLRYRKDMPESNARQAYFPKGSIILTNNNGTANACIVESQERVKSEHSVSGEVPKKIGILLPGPPKEMMPLMDEEVIPYLSKYSNEVVIGKKVAVTRIGESKAESMIMDLIDKQSNPTIAPYASVGRVVFRVTAKAKSKEEALKLLEPVVDELLSRFGNDAVLLEEGKLEDITCKLLLDKHITISTAESCTGGNIAVALVGYAGISEVFKEGFVTYSNDAKMKDLGVDPNTVDKFGAVSEECAKEMAFGAANRSGADLGVATTGIAGPGGGTEDKPVGLVYTCVYYKGQYHVNRSVHNGNRETVRERATANAFDMIRRVIE